MERRRLSKANLLLGQAYESLNQPVKMLCIGTVERYALEGGMRWMRLLRIILRSMIVIKKFERTVLFIDQFENEIEFRTRMVTDRGALFEEFYEPDIEQSLYNDLRHPAFTEDLIDDYSPSLK